LWLLQQRLQRGVAADVGAEAPLRVRTLADAAPERCVLRQHARHLRANEPPAHAQPPAAANISTHVSSSSRHRSSKGRFTSEATFLRANLQAQEPPSPPSSSSSSSSGGGGGGREMPRSGRR
jgi:hypothetical protein